MKTRALVLALWVLPLVPAKDKPPLHPVNINTATVEELETLPGIGQARAEMIVRVRERSGPFKKIEELRALPRLSEKQFRRLRKYVTVGSPVQDTEAGVSPG